MLLRFAFAILFALGLSPAALCQVPALSTSASPSNSARISTLLADLARVRAPQTVAISPDGAQLAWTVDGPRGSELHLTGLAPHNSAPPDSAQDAAPHPDADRVLSPDTIADVTNNRPGRCSASHPAWSPDGAQLAFLSDCDSAADPAHPDSVAPSPSAQKNIFVWTLAVNGMKQISHLRGEISDLQWSPDGQSIAFLFVENATRRANATDAIDPLTGVIGQDHIEVQRVAAVKAKDGKFFYITPPNLHVYEFAWGGRDYAISRNGMTYVAAPPPGENNWWVARLYAQPVCTILFGFFNSASPCAGLENPRIVFDPATTPGQLHGLQIAVPRFSPDGKHIAFIGGLMSDQGAVGGDIYLIPAAGLAPGAQPTNLTPNRAASPAWIAWLDSSSLLVSEHAGGSVHLTELELRTSAGSITATDNPAVSLTLPATVIAGFDVMSVSLSTTTGSAGDAKAGSRIQTLALIEQSFSQPPEVFAGPLDHLNQMTHLNDALKPSWGRAESIDYANDGFHLQGWLLYPANYNPAKKYPLIVSVHGGPSSALTPHWPADSYSAVPFSSLGSFVFMPNPRGSFGQGEAFTQANVKDFGYGDLRDILAGVDLLEKRLPIDRAREGITGWSYGGFMAMFAVTQTTRFRAAVAGAGISNWQSYYGENSIDQWMVPFFGASVYDSPAVYARSSAINFVKNVKTPTLLIVGDRDGECPAPQSFEFWHALRDEGVKTQLVVYPNEGHHFSDPDHQRDVLARSLDWFETQMPAQP